MTHSESKKEVEKVGYNFWSWYKKLIVKNIKTGKKREVLKSKQRLLKENLKVGDYINTEEYIVKIIGKEN